MSTEPSLRLQQLRTLASSWREPENASRVNAVSIYREGEDPFSEEVVAFAINQRMTRLLDEEALTWSSRLPENTPPQTIALVRCSPVPLAGFWALTGALLSGHELHIYDVAGEVSLMSSFFRELPAELPLSWHALEELDEAASSIDRAIIVGEPSDSSTIVGNFTELGVSEDATVRVNKGVSIGVVGASPVQDEWEGLAEDMLLYDGFGAGSVRLLFAPSEMPPDELAEACALFRGVYPVRDSTPGRLSMQQAMLDAFDTPHVYGEGLEFLISKGDPEIQQRGHIRWVPYNHASEITQWIDRTELALSQIVATDGIRDDVERIRDALPPGEAHRPPAGGRLPERFFTLMSGTRRE